MMIIPFTKHVSASESRKANAIDTKEITPRPEVKNFFTKSIASPRFATSSVEHSVSKRVDKKMWSNKLNAFPLACLSIVAGLVSLLPGSTLSQTPFYQGKTITLLQSTQAGDTSDTMTRAIVPYLKKHIPGEPT